jgi:predicted acylesterase/phospholipase RssA
MGRYFARAWVLASTVHRVLICLYACALASLVSACATAIPRNGISDAAVAERAVPLKVPGVRFWHDEVPPDPVAELKRRSPRLPQIAANAKRTDGRVIVETLALSGGGADGAFGAGVLAGWTERGDRPEFEIVTGVSAGAIIAPFAYLGPTHDGKLREIWTEYKQSDIVTASFLPGILGGPALTDSGPFARLIAQYVDQPILDAIAAEYQRGRMLLVLTTNLDAQRPVVWNMGEIALNKSPEALQLFRNVLLASASIPGALPPVKIDVEADGKVYDELHVDGGTTREVFVTAVQASYKALDSLYARPPIRRIYAIKNGKLTPETQVVEASTLKIAARSISTLIKSQSSNDLYRIWRTAKDANASFNLMAVPASFTRTTEKFYDPAYQVALYREGIEAGKAGVWMPEPPGATPIEPVVKKKTKPVVAKPTISPAPAPAPTQIAPPATSQWTPSVTAQPAS